jgi:nitroreductase
MDIKTIMQTRYATKLFTGESISEEQLSQLKEMIKLAPTSFGLQAFKVKIVSDKETKEKLLPASWNQPQITTCSHLLVFCTNLDVETRLEEYKELLAKHETPTEKIEMFAGMIQGFLQSMDKEAIHTWAAKQTYIALAHAMLGAKALGFDSCPMEGFDAKAYHEILGLPEQFRPVVICPVGIAADEPRPKQRFDDLFL